MKTTLMLCIFIVVSSTLVIQNEACLDLLIRSFNKIFNPVIEASERRVQKPHNVDEITRLYKRDENGNLILQDLSWLAANPFVKSINPKSSKSRSVFEHLNARMIPDEHVYPSMDLDYEEGVETTNNTDDIVVMKLTTQPAKTENKSNESNASNEENNSENVRTLHKANEDYFYRDDYPEIETNYRHNNKPGVYVPGKRPYVDFLIKVLELFQLTGPSEFLFTPPNNDTR